jgi:hypothetical protein
MRAHLLAALSALGLTLAPCAGARADDTPAEPTEFDAGETWREPVDSTRLDVARLPADVIPVTRDLYASGLFVEGRLGVSVAGGALGQVANPGPRLEALVGYTFFRVLSVYAGASFSQHDTHHRPPPAATSFELLEPQVGVRGDIPFGPRLAMFVAGSGSVLFTFGDVLRGLGFRDAVTPSIAYGGELGLDYHLRALHHSLGLSGGARVYPGLERNGASYAGYASAYVRYVF